jgi:hypothetical protein
MITDATEWAKETFKDSELGDPRRTRRLIRLACSYAKNIGSSTVECCEGDDAQVEGAYRFLRNDGVKPGAIRAGGFRSTARLAAAKGILLAIEDTTTISYKHEVAKGLGYTSSRALAKTKGFNVHSVLLLSEATGETIGLIEQSWFCRDNGDYGKSAARKKRSYQDKESYKWESASRNMSEILGEKMKDIISICDREADIYDYLFYKLSQQQRFIVRAREDRKTTSEEHKLFNQVLDTPILGTYKVSIEQRGGRKARIATVEYHSARVEIVLPKHQHKQGYPATLSVNVVAAKEINNSKMREGLEWILLTTEEVDTRESGRKVLKNYEQRWRIEDFHKAWKSGVGVEGLRLQSKENLERAGSILAFVAVKLLQMREIALSRSNELTQAIRVTNLLTKDEWRVLWVTTKKTKPPRKLPNIKWAYESLGKLGGWYDSKRTGIVGWKALWKGWFRLMDRVELYNDAKLYL